MKKLVLANARNGLVYPHDDVCLFKSSWYHGVNRIYYRDYSMPLGAIVHLFKGGDIEIVDATVNRDHMSDGLKYGVVAWCVLYNRMLLKCNTKTCAWEDNNMVKEADKHKAYCEVLSRIAKLYSNKKPAVIGKNITLTCHFIKGENFDDSDFLLKKLVK